MKKQLFKSEAHVSPASEAETVVPYILDSVRKQRLTAIAAAMNQSKVRSQASAGGSCEG